MSRNPYADALGRHDPVEVIASTPEKLAAQLKGLNAEQLEKRSAAGKWNIREIVAHLADCEIAFGFRLRQGAAGVEMIQPFDQDAWARNYHAYNFDMAMKTFRTLREWNVALARSLTEEQKRRRITHPERGEMTAWTVVETMAGHDRHHLAALETMLQRLA